MVEQTTEVRCWNTHAIGLRIEKRAVGEKTISTVVGHAAVFNQLSDDLGGFRERIKKGAFKRSLGEDGSVVANIEHASGLATLGRTPDTLRIREDRVGLLTEIDLPNTTAGVDVAELIETKRLKGMSFKFRTIADKWNIEDGEEVRTLEDVDLLDVTITAEPAYPQTDVAMRSLEAAKRESGDQVKADLVRLRRQSQLREFQLTEAQRCCKL